ncbi:MAG: anthranilate/aminodeoxychorismate synthase component II [Candidatus Neomarinimicrobiota bacterium]|nr:aminodeoxychorismate/anthranilate synthase component II [Candidatus Neomarinimicrobiota bacterium]RKY51639.1 MAG: anthranilate/aminodeoxychorismate synthase component II [Candidatus Neomarinimicrobiota bacterium]
MILFIDNFDSFTYNLVQIFGSRGEKIHVIRNNEADIDYIRQLNPDGIVISPGPGYPEKAGISLAVIQTFYRDIPVLGVCLGHQCIAAAFGGKIIQEKNPVHGKTSEIFHNGYILYRQIPSPFFATRYHSLVADPHSLPPSLCVDARTKDGLIMGIHHREYPVSGVQFHPESILTSFGETLIHNWLDAFIIKESSENKQHTEEPWKH